MNNFKKILSVFAAILWGGGVVGGIGMAINLKAPIMVVAIIVLGVLAFPTVRKLLTEE